MPNGWFNPLGNSMTATKREKDRWVRVLLLRNAIDMVNRV
jgi:putative exporter of polyketide antibiotics